MTRLRLPRFAALLAMLTLGGVFAFLLPVDVWAQSETLTEVGDATGLGSEDPRIVVASIIRIALTLLGVLAVVVCLYGGFVWMTAGGNAEKVERAKHILIRGAIGVAIILMSWAITSFIISALVSATTGSGGSGDFDSSSGSGLGGSSTSSFTVTDYSPDSAVAIRNVQLRVTFSKNLDETTVDGNIVITNASTGAEVDGTLVVSGNYATFTPSAACPSPNEDRYCFDADTEFTVAVSDAIESSTGTALVCSSDRCVSSFTTGSLVDTEDPDVTVTDPESGDGVATDSSENVQVAATDDSEVASAEFALDGTAFDSVGATGDDLSSVTIETTLDTSDLENGERYRIAVTVTDIAGNTSDDSVTVTARPAWCFNGELDEDLGETGVDCGGDSTSDEYCGACDGSSCTEDSECSSGSCVDGACVTLPEIESVSPESGAVGTYVTISGSGFGVMEGAITFTAEDGTSTVEAELPDCGDGWTSSEIVVEVPEGAGDGPITLTTYDGDSDATNDDEGALIDDFDVNDTVHPKLCNLTPDDGASTDAVSFDGADFGDAQGESTVTFGDSEAGSYTSWADTSLALTVPSLEDDEYEVVVTVDGVESNALTFTVAEDDGAVPTIIGIDPSSGAIGEYVTISGTNFGGSTGTVWFASAESGALALASTDFPAACDEDFWSDDEITVIVPDTFQNDEAVTVGEYTVYVTTADGDDSGTEDFTIEDGEPGPGLCAVDPDTGEAGDTVTLYGERLGSDTGTVAFYDGVSATVAEDGWSDDEITVTVPTGVATGPVSVTSSAGEESNTIDFEAGTASSGEDAEVAAASYGWYFSTGEIPETPELLVACSDTTVSGVPNVQFTEDVCVNAVVYAEFSVLMDEGSVSDAVTVAACTSDGDQPCDTTSEVDGTLTVSSSATATAFEFVPSADWSTDTTYQVTVADTATSEDDLTIAETVTWTFTTGATDAECAVEAVYISPESATIDTQGDTTAFSAIPVTGCVVTDADGYVWDWTVDNSYADFTSSEDGTCDGGTTSCATVQGLAEGETDVTAQETDSGVDGSGELTINFTDPYVDNYAPDCEEACRDAEISATFNTAMDRATVLADAAVVLYECANELCTNLTEFGSYAVACESLTEGDDDRCDKAVFVLDAELTENTYYRVIVSGNVTSVSDVPLTRTNYHGDFSWTFKVKDGEAVCAVSRIAVTPDAADATAIGQRQTFSVDAYGEPDSCSEAGQELASTSYDWSWTDPIADDGDDTSIAVAEWWDSASVDTDASGIAEGCTTQCTAGGSESYAAICGDGTVGTGEECEDGNTVDDDGCSSSCLREGGDVVGTCGDGTLDQDGYGAGEDCDDGNLEDGDGCSSACLNEGSESVSAECGNSDVAYDESVGGEDCDDGNLTRGDGCDTQCLNEGAPTLSSVGGAVCGNGTIDEPYENCDTALTSEGCSDACLLEGASAQYMTPSVCGDTTIGTGEECDEGDAQSGDGCSSDCLLEGASTSYDTPSFCGDGVEGIGEWDACEATAGDGYVDALQLASIADDAASEVDVDTHEVAASIAVTEPTSGISTTATYTLSCTAATDLDCPDETLYGVGVANCCALRPTAALVPTDGETEVCRNALLYATFSEEMDTASFAAEDDDGTSTPRMYAALDLTTTSDGQCPSTHTTLAMEPRGVFARAWLGIRRFFTGVPASADSGDCVLPIVGYEQTANDDGTYTVRMRYSAAMEANADYTLVLATDPDNTDGEAEGVLSQSGVGIFNALDVDRESATFTTGSDICTLDVVVVEDTDEESPNAFTQSGEAHTFTATGMSYATGEAVEITSIDDVYAWEFSATAGWEEDSAETVVTVEQSSSAATEATVTAAGENGDANVTATATITADDLGGTEGDVVTGTTSVTAYLCEYPWPALEEFPWEDSDMHFSTYYCLDAGADDETTDDYPEVMVVEAAARPITDDNVLREYLFEVADSTDAIGVRIVSNDEYLSPEAWYYAQGFTGSPQTTTVDGFEAATDGRTTYIAAPNDSGAGIYANIYVVSYNEGASEETIDIFNQIVANLSFATNIEDDGLCYEDTLGSASIATDANGDTVDCDDDSDCAEITDGYCGDAKAKLTRDTKRLADLTTIAAAVEEYGDENGICSATVDRSCEATTDCPTGETCEAVVPTLASGTYVRSLGASAWTSWSDVLGAAIDLEDSVVDPLNVFNGCGEGDLSAYDATTCVEAASGNYVCPDGSYAYHYRAVGSQEFALAADLEYNDGAWVNTLDDDTDDAVTYYAAHESADTTVTGFTTDYFCESDDVYGSTGVCGDGVINTESDGTVEACEIGDRGGTAATCDSDGDGTDDGTQEQTCNSTCTGWTDDEDAECIPESCGNAVVDSGEDCDDGDDNGRYEYCGADCTDSSRTYCGDGELQGSETCDCGAPSLSASPTDARPYGGADATCAGVNGTYDANIDLTCAWDCEGPASYCGDGTVDEDEGETCDTTADTYDGALCCGGENNGEQCTSNADCPDSDFSAGYCGYDAAVAAGVSSFFLGVYCPESKNACPADESGYATTRTKSCDTTCAWDTTYDWEDIACEPSGSCGDGTIDDNEECDDGNDTNTDECTNACLYNVCGDGYLYSGEEACDEGADNGQGCESNYESSCTACSATCTYEVSSGDFCGDGDVNGDEYCDAYDLPYAWYVETLGIGRVLEDCDRIYEGQSYYSVYGTGYRDGSITLFPTCTQVGICNGDSDNGDYCTVDSDCSSGSCVFPSCADDCASACPFTYDDGSLLLTDNQPGAQSAESVDLYTYDESATSDIPNAATITIPACDAAESITVDVSMDNVTPPETFVMFITDLTPSMDYVVEENRDAEADEESRLAIAQEGLESAIGTLFDELGDAMNIGLVGFKKMPAGECYVDGESCSSDSDCTTYSDDTCNDTTAYLESYPFTGSSSEDDLVTEVNSYFADNGGNGTPTYEMLVEVKDLMDEAYARYGATNTRYILVFLTDGQWNTSTDPAGIAEDIRDAGYEFYTAAINEDEDMIAEAASWSSGNPDSETGIDYAYDAQTSTELEEMFQQIVDSIVGIGVTIISDDNDDTDTDAQEDSGAVEPGTDVALPWPSGFSCDPNSAQELPVRFNFQGEGQIKISNARINYCAP